MREDPNNRQGRGDRRRREDQGKEKGERPEDEREDDERDRNGDVELADLEVTFEHRIKIMLNRGLAGDVELCARHGAGRGTHRAGVALRVGWLEIRHDAGTDNGVGHRLHR